MRISKKVWNRYAKTLNRLSAAAASEMERAYETLVASGLTDAELRQGLIAAAQAIAAKYGNAAGAAACEIYDAVAAAQRASVPAALPAATATRGEAAKAVDNAMFRSKRADVLGSAVGQLVKQAGADTTLMNARRDGAQWAWVPSAGETCAFCIELAGFGWLPASKAQMDGDHAEHIHPNCGCAFAIRFGDDLDIAGYNPGVYKRLFDDAPGATEDEKLNAMRRSFYKENKAEIQAQKRDAYAKRQELNAPSAEETVVG